MLAIADPFEKRAWNVRGEAVQDWRWPKELGSNPFRPGLNPSNFRSFILRVETSESVAPSVFVRTVPNAKSAGDKSVPRKVGPNSGWFVASTYDFPVHLSEIDLQVGLACGRWSNNGTVQLRKFPSPLTVHGFKLVFKENLTSGEYSLAVSASLPTSLVGREVRFVLYDRTNTEMRFVGTRTVGDSPLERIYRGSIRDLSRLELQSRQILWTTFPRVPLYSLGPT